ncbi:MAG: hypothetical protein EG823_01950 [Actinobacteria bacterium]|nr:hypothetical protein [Actinomycetota bacterium]
MSGRRFCAALCAAALGISVLALSPSRGGMADALVPLPEYVTFIRDGALEQALAGSDSATVLVDPASLPAEDPGFTAPLVVAAHWWAPDGTHVLVGARSTATGEQRLFICGNDGLNPVQVTAGGGVFRGRGETPGALWDCPESAWSPDGQQLALTVLAEGAPAFGDIYVVGLDGTGELVGSGVEPAWSPDGARIAYVRAVPEATDLDSARPYVTVGTIGGGSVDLGLGREPLFSPDGAEVLYRTWTDSGGEGGDPEQLAIAPADGGAERLLTAYGPDDDMGGPSDILDHRFSPDGSKVYFLQGRRSDSRYVFEVAADGSSPEPVVVSGLATEFCLSLDGSHVIYTGGSIEEASWQTRQQVYSRGLEMDVEVQLSPTMLADYTCSNLSVSNQNRYVAFDAMILPVGELPGSATTREVWVASIDGAYVRRCAENASGVASQPAWTPVVDGNGALEGDAETDSSGTSFWDRIGDAIAGFFRWLAGLFD